MIASGTGGGHLEPMRPADRKGSSHDARSTRSTACAHDVEGEGPRWRVVIAPRARQKPDGRRCSHPLLAVLSATPSRPGLSRPRGRSRPTSPTPRVSRRPVPTPQPRPRSGQAAVASRASSSPSTGGCLDVGPQARRCRSDAAYLSEAVVEASALGDQVRAAFAPSAWATAAPTWRGTADLVVARSFGPRRHRRVRSPAPPGRRRPHGQRTTGRPQARVGRMTAGRTRSAGRRRRGGPPTTPPCAPS